MKIKITQDLSEVKAKEFYGFTRRQFIGLITATVVCLPTYWLIHRISGIDSAMLRFLCYR